VNDIAVAAGVDSDGAPVVVKLALSDSGGRALERAAEALSSVTADPRLAGWRTPRPAIVSRGESDQLPYLVESALAGTSAAALLDGGADLAELMGIALDAIEGLHRLTALEARIDAELLDDWLHQPAVAIEALVARSPQRVA